MNPQEHLATVQVKHHGARAQPWLEVVAVSPGAAAMHPAHKGHVAHVSCPGTLARDATLLWRTFGPEKKVYIKAFLNIKGINTCCSVCSELGVRQFFNLATRRRGVKMSYFCRQNF